MSPACITSAPVLLIALGTVALPVLNEILYDPDGADGGAEFVEIHHAGPDSAHLAGARLEFANGAEEPAWQVRWEAPPGTVLPPGGFFLVADRGWTGPVADALADLDLQNGPDAVRLVLADGTVDLVGYGDLVWPELAEGAPAPDVASGFALARRPDGRDTGDNATDLVAATPTPGAPNFAPLDLRLVATRCEPPTLRRAGETTRVTVRLANHGLDWLPPTRGRLALADDAVEIAVPPVPATAETVATAELAAVAAGRQALTLTVDGSTPDQHWEFDLGWLQVGPGPVIISEVMAAPEAGGEWVELQNLDSGPRSLAGLQLRDEDGAWRGLPDLVVAPGAFAVVAEDTAALRGWWDPLRRAAAPDGCDQPLGTGRCTSTLGGWPGLNNTPPASRDFPDRVWLADTSGAVVDHARLETATVVAGRSVERVAPEWAGDEARGWRAATTPAGATPGCGNSVASPAVPTLAGLEVSPNPFDPAGGDGAVHLRFRVQDGQIGWGLVVHDLWGQRVRDLGGDDLGAGPRDLLWDGRDEGGRLVPPGGYVVVLRLRDPTGTVVAGGKRLVVVRGDGR